MDSSIIGSLWQRVTDISTDVFAISLVVIVLFTYGVRTGKRRLISLILSSYVALAAYLYFPYREAALLFRDTPMQLLLSNVLIFAVFLLAAHILIGRFITAEFPFGSGGKWFEATILSLLATALILAIFYHVLSISDVVDFDKNVDVLFASSSSFFWWLILPLAGTFALSHRSV